MAKLLLVDDDPKKLRLLKKIARRASFDDIATASSVSETLKQLESDTEFDLAVIDVVLTRLPEKLGLRLIEHVKSTQPNCKIIGLTARGGTDFGVEALEAGADDFVSTKWDAVNWVALLEQRLIMWRGLINGLINV